MDAGWIEHRRGTDRELLGCIQAVGEHFMAVDLLGRARTSAVDWLAAEEALDALGLGYLAEPYELRLESGAWLRVRITEVSTESIRVKKTTGRRSMRLNSSSLCRFQSAGNSVQREDNRTPFARFSGLINLR